MQISVIIPQYGRWQLTMEAVSTLLLWHPAPVEIIVVDDGSPESDWKATQANLPAETRLVRQAHQGVTAAWNRGWEAATGDILVFLNNDACSQQPWLSQVADKLSCNPQQLIGAAWQSERACRSVPAEFFPKGKRCPLLSGWMLACRRETADEMGRFNEQMQLYWSDTDWQLRWLHHFQGSDPLVCLPSGYLRHAAHATTRHQSDRRSLWRQDRRAFRKFWMETIRGREA